MAALAEPSCSRPQQSANPFGLPQGQGALVERDGRVRGLCFDIPPLWRLSATPPSEFSGTGPDTVMPIGIVCRVCDATPW